jgi:hypothetical protein
VWLGIDFSGDVARWGPAVGRTNVWIATLEGDPSRPKLCSVRPVQGLPGVAHPFQRLAEQLGRGAYRAAAIDAPFSIPEAFRPVGGRAQLLDLVAGLPTGGRPFPTGKAFVAAVTGGAPVRPPKPRRRTEEVWHRLGVNVRSALWAGPRSGAAFTAACLMLIVLSARPCWPWSQARPGLLVEAFPAGQLRHSGLPHRRYAGDADLDRANRARIVEALRRRIDLDDDKVLLLQRNADALDAVIAALAAVAVDAGMVVPPPSHNDEGWIAVHP